MNNQIKIILFVFLGFYCACCFSQGDILLKKKPLKDILIEIEKEHNVKFSYEDKTIEKVFFIELISMNDLEVTLRIIEEETGLDFIKIDERFYAIKAKPKTLSNTIQKLDKIIIENYLTKGISKSSDGTINIKNETFGILPGLIAPDVLQTAQGLPGVFSTNELVSNLNVRGGTHDQNLILYNGIKMYQTAHFFGLNSAFNPYLSSEINVSKNGTKVKYGDGVSSIISINNSKKIADKSDIGFGFDGLSIDAYSKLPISKKSELQLSARRSYTDLVQTPTYQSFTDRILNNTSSNSNIFSDSKTDENLFFYDWSAQYHHQFNPSTTLTFNAINIFNKINFLDNTNFISENELTQKTLAGGLNFKKVWDNKLISNVLLYYNNYDYQAEKNQFLINSIQNQENKVEDLGLKLDFNKPVDKRLILNFGYQFNEIGITNSESINQINFLDLNKEVIRTHGIYGEAEFTSKSKKTYSRIGLRANYIEQFGQIYSEPRVSVSHKLSNSLRLEFLGELKSQVTSQIIDIQQNFIGIERQRWQLANNDNIPILNSQQASLGMSYNKNGLVFSIEAFTKTVYGITTSSQGFQNQYQISSDTGRYQINGFDFLINKQIKQFSLWASYTFANNNYKFENLNSGIDFPNNVDISHNINFASTYEISNFKMALGVNWHSGIPFTTVSDNQNSFNNIVEYDSPNNSNLKDYFRTDFSANYKFKIYKSNAELGIAFLNILDRNNIINRYYNIDNNQNINEINNVALGFTPNFNFRIQF